jgi:hypothetical protein
MNAFNDQASTRKGTLGEQIGEAWLRKRGFHVYRPSDLEQAHPVDRIAIAPGAMNALICDMKSKPVRTKYDDTGIDLEHWHRYRMLSEIHQMRALLVFIDEDLAKVYGNFLDVLDVVRPHRARKTTGA